MASIPLPALAVQPPPSVADMYLKAAQIRGLLLGQQVSAADLQGKQLDNQAVQMQLNTQKQVVAATQDKDWDPTNPDAVVKVLRRYNVPVTAQANVMTGIRQMNESLNSASADQLNQLQQSHQFFDDQLQAAKSAPPDSKESVYQQGLSAMQQRISMLPNGPAKAIAMRDLQKVPALYDDNWINQQHGLLVTSKALGEQALNKAQVAESQAKAAQANSESNLAFAKIPGAQAESAIQGITLGRIQNSKSGDFDSQIDQLAPPDGRLAQFNQPLKVAVNGALARGDYDTAQKILTDGFNQIGDINKETNPAVVQARANIAGATAAASEAVRQQFGNDKDARDKIDQTVLKPYQDKMSEISELQSAIGQAQAGNIAAARATLYKVIGVAQPQGTHRVAPTEVAGFSGMGSVPQRVQGSIANALSGDQWTPQMIADIKSFGDAQSQVAQQNLNRGVDATNQLYKTNVGTGLKVSGQVQVQDPQGGTHTFPDQASADKFKKLAGIQ